MKCQVPNVIKIRPDCFATYKSWYPKSF